MMYVLFVSATSIGAVKMHQFSNSAFFVVENQSMWYLGGGGFISKILQIFLKSSGKNPPKIKKNQKLSRNKSSFRLHFVFM